ncbi:MAG: CTAG/PCC1 family protein [Candidatus Thermoplasmatota archaeon]|nr:CTAG/PCC1 family protein [Candidatus Thermoplasmatota archaeon]MBU1941303.1 CTAG/PCC1 family protein [Candidatus Thermoplasmatota archaeon]
MSYVLLVTIPCATDQEAVIIKSALSPEMQIKMSKAKVSLTTHGADLRFNITTKDLSTFRAVMNSYLRWIETAMKVYHLQ